MSAGVVIDAAVTVCFGVVFEGGAKDVGTWSSCEGLTVSIEVKGVKAGGNNRFEHKLAGRVLYENIKLTRPVNKDTRTVAEWITTMVSMVEAGQVDRTTAAITAYNQHLDRIATWNLQGVIPIKWSGPSFNVDGPKVAMETLELAHHGFTVDVA